MLNVIYVINVVFQIYKGCYIVNFNFSSYIEGMSLSAFKASGRSENKAVLAGTDL